MAISKQSKIVYVIWITLAVSAALAIWRGVWDEAFIALLTLSLSFLPSVFEDRFKIHLPLSVSAVIVLFLFATLFLGEIGDFYERYWWWDVVMHSGSALGIGLIGFVLIFMLFEGDKYAAPAYALALLSVFVAIAIGGIWEIFEYLMDSWFAMNMQKSGLQDTMWDMIVNAIGATIAGLSGYFYLRGKWFGGLSRTIDQFVKANKSFFRKNN